MKTKKTSQKTLSGDHFKNLDAEMHNYFINKNIDQKEIIEFSRLRGLIVEKLSSREYSFNPFFAESILNKIKTTSSNHISFDITFILSLFLRRVMFATLFTIIFLVLYFYIMHGSISEFILMNPEKLNDMKLISSILYDI